MNQVTEALATVWPVIWANDFLRYALAAGALALLLKVFPGWARRRKTQARLASSADKRREILYSVSTVTIFSLVGVGLYLGRDSGVFQLYLDPVSWRVVISELVIMVLIHDAYFYWIHRAMHQPLLFRRFHRLHHLSRTPTPWTAYAFAPAEAVLEAGILPLVALVMPVSAVTVFAFTTHMIIRNVMGHAGVELWPRWWLSWPVLRWVTTTTHHDLHHERGRSNYGFYFTFWDRLMGTEHEEYEARFTKNVSRAAAPIGVGAGKGADAEIGRLLPE